MRKKGVIATAVTTTQVRRAKLPTKKSEQRVQASHETENMDLEYIAGSTRTVVGQRLLATQVENLTTRRAARER